jgi:hypothetical protein
MGFASYDALATSPTKPGCSSVAKGNNVRVNFQDALQQVAVLQHLLAVPTGNGLRLLDGLLGSYGEFVQVHGVRNCLQCSIHGP